MKQFMHCTFPRVSNWSIPMGLLLVGCVASRISDDDDGAKNGASTSTGSGGSAASSSGSGGSGGETESAAESTTTGTSTGSGGSDIFDPPFMLGADISSVQELNVEFIDTDGRSKSIFELLKSHGFNTIRLRTFVDPHAEYGYASRANGCAGFDEPYGDRDHVVAFGKQIKQAGMGFLLNFHYSDVWADPGNQIIPEAWRDADSIEALAQLMKEYTIDVVSTAIAAGARPDIVQVGNEITPGILAHVPGPDTDCWGNYPVLAPIHGSTANWDNLATLLIAGIEGVREVDPTIKIMLHLENTDDVEGVEWWVDSALSRGVEFDVLGLSCYTTWQGPPAVWEATFEKLAETYAELEFVIAEYNPERTAANLVIKNLPDGRGLGTFIWEPTQSGSWGSALFEPESDGLHARPEAFAEFDALLPQLGLARDQ